MRHRSERENAKCNYLFQEICFQAECTLSLSLSSGIVGITPENISETMGDISQLLRANGGAVATRLSGR